MLQCNIVSYIKMREMMTMEEVENDQGLAEADGYILEIGYQCYKQKIPIDNVLKFIKGHGSLLKRPVEVYNIEDLETLPFNSNKLQN